MRLGFPDVSIDIVKTHDRSLRQSGEPDGRDRPDLTQAENADRRHSAFRLWAASLTPDDIGGAAVLFGLLFAALGFGGW